MAATPLPVKAPGPPWSVPDVLLAAAGAGVLAGLVEAGAAGIRSRLMHVTLFVGPEMVWQLPLADGLIFLFAALPVVLAGVVWPRLRAPRVVIALFAGLVAFALLLLTEKIHIAAEAILAAGLGVAAARALAPRSDRLRSGLRIGVPAAIALLAVVALAQARMRVSLERRLLGALPALPAGRPNILLVVLDTVRAWSLGLYGYGRPTTPKLAQWARSGTLFQRALAPAPWTTLSHAAMFTGRYATELSVSWRMPYDGAYPTLAETLRDAGYATAGFAGNYLNVGRGTGLSRGFLHYEDYPFEAVQLLRSTTMLGRVLREDPVKEVVGRRRMIPELVGTEVNRRSLGWLARHGEKPWFAFLNYFDAHGPYLPPAPYDTMYIGKADPVADRYWENLQRAYGPPPVALQELTDALDAYDGAITYLDLQVDSLLGALSARGQLGNTIVVITSDHGELFGEHGVLGHGTSLFLPVLHVPLLVVAPGRAPAGAQVPSLASLRDLPATLLDLAGLRNPGLPGHSLVPLGKAGPGALTDTLFASVDYNWLIPRWPPSPVLRGPMQTVLLDSLQYIRNGDGAEELYHLGQDSWEIHNLVAVPEYQRELDRYRGALRALPPGKPGPER